MGHWRKLGRISDGLVVDGFTTGFAAVPTAEWRSGDVYRIYVSARSEASHSLPVWFDFDLSSRQIVGVAEAPILGLGALGCFDDAGVMPCWLMPQGDDLLMYYIGWNQGVSVPFRNSIGLAKRGEDGAWQRCFEGPVLDRTATEPHFVASCAALEHQGQTFNWYLSCTGWSAHDSGPRHHYHIKVATSDDGSTWHRSGTVAIDFAPGEYAISRPCPVTEADGTLSMWFSARGEAYQIFKATSVDGLSWVRAPEPVLTASQDGWDADMVCYPFVFDHQGERFMLFNGNGYGRSGLGLAIWEGPNK